MKILFAASEMTPLAKVGGLGDVIGSLPKALRGIGLDVSVVIPRYEKIGVGELALVKKMDDATTLYAEEVDGVQVYFVDNVEHIGTGPIYFEKTAFAGSQNEIDRFVFFSRAVEQFIRNGVLKADLLHCHDWHTAALVRAFKDDPLPTIYTIHNLGNQGAIGGVNWMAEGIRHADMVTTVSPTYAQEIQTKAFGAGLEKLLQARAKEGKLAGILNGIDYSFWPVKERDKAAFQKERELEEDERAPIFGLVSRLTTQKGVRLILPNVSEMVTKHDAQFVFLGQGEEEIEQGLKELVQRHPAHVDTTVGFDEKLAHRIYGQSDFFLMPSRFEPSGLGQMIAMHYGTIPIVRATGGLKDSVRDGVTGFVFEKENPEAVREAMMRAVTLFADKDAYQKMRRTCMEQDFDWDVAAEEYKKLYQRIFEVQAGK